jgi:citrate lyase gamma subunit
MGNGGNSRMMLENYQSTEMNTNISTYTDLVSEVSNTVTQDYVNKTKIVSRNINTIVQTIDLGDISVSGKGQVNIQFDAAIDSSQQHIANVFQHRTVKLDLQNTMATSLEQALSAQAGMSTTQDAKNLLAQARKNAGGLDGAAVAVAESMSAGGNQEQEVRNIMKTRMNLNIDTNIGIRNAIRSHIHQQFGSETESICESQNNIIQALKAGDITVTDEGQFNAFLNAQIQNVQ